MKIDKSKLNCLVDHGGMPCPGYPSPTMKECICHSIETNCPIVDPDCPIHCQPSEEKPSDQQECGCWLGFPVKSKPLIDKDCPIHGKPPSSTDTALLQAIEYLLSDEGKKKIIELVKKHTQGTQ